MAINLPNNPSNLQTFVLGDSIYRYNADKSRWDLVEQVADGAGSTVDPLLTSPGGSRTLEGLIIDGISYNIDVNQNRIIVLDETPREVSLGDLFIFMNGLFADVSAGSIMLSTANFDPENLPEGIIEITTQESVVDVRATQVNNNEATISIFRHGSTTPESTTTITAGAHTSFDTDANGNLQIVGIDTTIDDIFGARPYSATTEYVQNNLVFNPDTGSMFAVISATAPAGTSLTDTDHFLQVSRVATGSIESINVRDAFSSVVAAAGGSIIIAGNGPTNTVRLPNTSTSGLQAMLRAFGVSSDDINLPADGVNAVLTYTSRTDTNVEAFGAFNNAVVVTAQIPAGATLTIEPNTSGTPYRALRATTVGQDIITAFLGFSPVARYEFQRDALLTGPQVSIIPSPTIETQLDEDSQTLDFRVAPRSITGSLIDLDTIAAENVTSEIALTSQLSDTAFTTREVQGFTVEGTNSVTVEAGSANTDITITLPTTFSSGQAFTVDNPAPVIDIEEAITGSTPEFTSLGPLQTAQNGANFFPNEIIYSENPDNPPPSSNIDYTNFLGSVPGGDWSNVRSILVGSNNAILTDLTEPNNQVLIYSDAGNWAIFNVTGTTEIPFAVGNVIIGAALGSGPVNSLGTIQDNARLITRGTAARNPFGARSPATFNITLDPSGTIYDGNVTGTFPALADARTAVGAMADAIVAMFGTGDNALEIVNIEDDADNIVEDPVAGTVSISVTTDTDVNITPTLAITGALPVGITIADPIVISRGGDRHSTYTLSNPGGAFSVSIVAASNEPVSTTLSRLSTLVTDSRFNQDLPRAWTPTTDVISPTERLIFFTSSDNDAITGLWSLTANHYGSTDTGLVRVGPVTVLSDGGVEIAGFTAGSAITNAGTITTVPAYPEQPSATEVSTHRTYSIGVDYDTNGIPTSRWEAIQPNPEAPGTGNPPHIPLRTLQIGGAIYDIGGAGDVGNVRVIGEYLSAPTGFNQYVVPGSQTFVIRLVNIDTSAANLGAIRDAASLTRDSEVLSTPVILRNGVVTVPDGLVNTVDVTYTYDYPAVGHSDNNRDDIVETWTFAGAFQDSLNPPQFDSVSIEAEVLFVDRRETPTGEFIVSDHDTTPDDGVTDPNAIRSALGAVTRDATGAVTLVPVSAGTFVNLANPLFPTQASINQGTAFAVNRINAFRNDDTTVLDTVTASTASSDQFEVPIIVPSATSGGVLNETVRFEYVLDTGLSGSARRLNPGNQPAGSGPQVERTLTTYEPFFYFTAGAGNTTFAPYSTIGLPPEIPRVLTAGVNISDTHWFINNTFEVNDTYATAGEFLYIAIPTRADNSTRLRITPQGSDGTIQLQRIGTAAAATIATEDTGESIAYNLYRAGQYTQPVTYIISAGGPVNG